MRASPEAATACEEPSTVGGRSTGEWRARRLCEVLGRRQAAERAGENRDNLTRAQHTLADPPGLSRAHIDRTFQALRHQRLIELRHGHMTIIGFTIFEKIAKFR
ncbi:helix-turn-helix domain-containing protein [Methylobacterium currus]|uniref:helix-turn-helix domain-containing protein n=1 Tax=Methylobacterium currus TaxID=2051553 RepID=UPI001E420F0E|nr:helix-turn-helix domain-containing protein [Methylobacterium currus]UHC14298.1 helix-turn-helix domain-containing protein [Methylobacterium currus]